MAPLAVMRIALFCSVVLASPALFGQVLGIDPLGGSQEITFTEDEDRGTVRFEVALGNAPPAEIELSRVSLRSDDFQVLIEETSAHGNVTGRYKREIPVETWRGSVRGLAGSDVRATLRDGKLSGIIYTPEGRWVIRPNGTATTGEGQHSVYAAPDSVDAEASCGAPLTSGASLHSVQGISTYTEGMLICDLAIDTDYEFYVANDSDIEKTVGDIEQLINGLLPIYEAQEVGVTYEITAIVVRTVESDPYEATSAEDLLGELAGRWTELPEVNIRADVCHLFTGRDLDGGTVGISELGVVCDDAHHFGLSQSNFSDEFAARVALTAHEIGHNWNASHCDEESDCRVMCSVITGCSGIYDSFSSTEAEQIAAFRSGVACLTEHQPAVALPFADSFEDRAIDRELWLYAIAAFVTSSAEEEPDGEQSLCICAAGPKEYQSGEVRSVHVLLGSCFSATLSLEYERIGVDDGEQLLIEYQNSALGWTTLAELTSDGSDSSAFERLEMTLPADALHDQFRLRFVAVVDDQDDRWYVDDVRIVETYPPPQVLSVNPDFGSLAGGETITVIGSDFRAGAVIEFGWTEVATEMVSTGELTATVPAWSTAERVAITVSQDSGKSTLADAYTYARYALSIGEARGAAGDAALVPVYADHSLDLMGFLFRVSSSDDFVHAEEVIFDPSITETASFVSSHIEAAGEWWSAEVYVDFTPPFSNGIPPSEETWIVEVIYSVDSDAEVGAIAQLSFENSPEAQPYCSLLHNEDSLWVKPELESGSIEVTKPGRVFLRGDAVENDAINLADAVAILQLLYSGRQVSCWDAADVDDSGALGLVDPMRLLQYLYLGGDPPAAPFPDEGTDDTEDALPCE